MFGQFKKQEKPPARAPLRSAMPQSLTVVDSTHSVAAPLELEVALSNEANSKPEWSDKVITEYAELPKFGRFLSIGEKPEISLLQTQRQSYVVVEVPTERGVVCLVDPAVYTKADMGSLSGKVRAAGMTWLRYVYVDPKLIQKVIKEAESQGDSRNRRSANSELFEQLKEWVNYAVVNRASDIHLETRGSHGVVRFRIDGSMETMRASHRGEYSAKTVFDAMSSLFNNEAQKKSGSATLFDADRHMYCMVPYNEIKDHKLKLRYQSFKGNEGPKSVLRLLNTDSNAKTLTFEELGYEPSQRALWRQAQQTPSGAAIIAGITGSGKTTTLKSFIELNPALTDMAIYTVEDPIEYPLKGTHQIHLQRDLLDEEESSRIYNDTMGALMRGDLDAAMVGELRDKDSANALVQIAESGHFAMATTHAHLLTGIVPRLTNEKMGLTRDVIAAPNILTLLVYQALVPVVCPDCGMTTDEIRKVDGEDVSDYINWIKKLKVDTTDLRWKRTGGCSTCNSRGTIGQTVVSEMLIPTRDWLTATREGRHHDAMEIYTRDSDGDLASQDMRGKTVLEHTLYKALTGKTDVRQCSRFDVFERFVHQHLSKQGIAV